MHRSTMRRLTPLLLWIGIGLPVVILSQLFPFSSQNRFFTEAEAQSVQTRVFSTPGEEGDSRTLASLDLRIYAVPKSFQPGYVTILSTMISPQYDYVGSSESILEQTLTDDISDATSALSEEEPTPISPQKYIEYDPGRNILAVLAAPEQHRQVNDFLHKLAEIRHQKMKILYHIAFIERTVHPRLRDYPFEFRIEGKTWGKGRNKDRKPIWIASLNQHHPNLFIPEIDLDREDKHTEFELKGYAASRDEMETLFQEIRQTEDTKEEFHWVEHDFMYESRQNLQGILSELFPNIQIEKIIQSLQNAYVYQAHSEASLVIESTVPGHAKTALGDDYAIEIQSPEEFNTENQAPLEISVYHKDHENDTPFEKNDLHLSTSLLSKPGQINMIGIRHPNKRYVLLLSLETLLN